MRADINYIYILLAVLYVIYSIVKASKKASQQKPATQNQKPQPSSTVQPPTASPLPKQKPEDDFKKMLEDLLGGAPEIEIPEKQIPKEKPQPVFIKPEPSKIVTHAKKIKATPSHTPSKTKEKEKPFLAEEKAAPKKLFAEIIAEEEPEIDFDIRQAIIYSEILKRPQY